MKLLISFLILSLSFSAMSDELVIYSARKEKFVKPLVEAFEKETGIKVKLLTGAKVVKILEEKSRPLANIFISNDIGQMEYLRLEEALMGHEYKQDFGIDKKYRAQDDSWIGLSARSRILMYNKSLIKESELPKSLEELADPKYKGQFMITRGGNGSMVAHVAALRAKWGDAKTTQWLKKIKDNAGAITKGHTQIRKGVGRGDYKFGLVNNYYFHLQKLGKKNNDVDAVYPDQKGMGVFVNSAGVALIRNKVNESSARKFMNWIVEPKNQVLFSLSSKEIPLNPGIERVKVGLGIDQYKTMDFSLKDLGQKWRATKKLIESSGLALELK